MTVQNELDLMQQFFRRVVGIETAPETKYYPPTLDTARLPIALSKLSRTNVFGANEDNYSLDEMTTLVVVAPLGYPNYGQVLYTGSTLINSVREAFVLDSNYLLENKVLQLQPYRIAVSGNSVKVSGMTVIEYPEGSEIFWHGFTVNYNLITDWRVSCE